MSTNSLHYGPYNNDPALDAGDTADTGLVVAGIPVLETILTASLVTAASPMPVDIGGGTIVNTAEVFNGAIPGPTFRLNAGDTVVVRLINVAFDYEVGVGQNGFSIRAKQFSRRG